MIEVKAYNAEGEAAAPVQVEEAWFGGNVRPGVLREAILMYQAKSHQGTANTRRRSEIKGSTRKLWRQKHTGRARVGDVSAPHRRGGASVFGPKPKEIISRRMPAKALRVALNSALLAKLADGEVIVADCNTPETPSTKHVAAYLDKIGIEKGQTCLWVTAGLDRTFYKSARNIAGVEVKSLSGLNAYAVVRPAMVIFGREAFEKLLERRR